jgi:hypothetical protein
MRTLVITTALLLTTMSLTAATLRGTVTDHQGIPIPGTTVTMTIDKKTNTHVSDVNGTFALESVPVARGVVHAELSGFRADDVKFNVTADSADVSVAVKLRFQPMEPIVIACGPARADEGSLFRMLRHEADNLPLGH